MRIPTIAIAISSIAACASAPVAPPTAADAASIQVMVLGTWHFAGSKTDIASAKTDSVLTPARQRELDLVARRLADFKPTVILSERVTAAPDYVDPKFAAFAGDDLLKNEDERVQIAYRLAASAGVTRVHGIDEQPSDGEPDYFPFDKLMEHAGATGQGGRIGQMIERTQQMVSDEAKRFSSMTMAQALIEANRGKIASPEFYYELLKFDAGEEQPGAELNGYWFMRNAKIFSKLIDVTKPGDRAIVVYGAGHKFWLEHLAEQTPGFAKVDPVPYLEGNR